MLRRAYTPLWALNETREGRIWGTRAIPFSHLGKEEDPQTEAEWLEYPMGTLFKERITIS